MSAVDRSEELLQSLHETLALLRALQAEGVDAVASDPVRWAGLRYLSQIAIQACVDLADQILALQGIAEPAHSRDVFPALARAGLLDAGIAGDLARLVGLRNALVQTTCTSCPRTWTGGWRASLRLLPHSPRRWPSSWIRRDTHTQRRCASS
ncbi:MAG: DUF86 domain-containing protein [Armatimonadetes bacterium]|nr:DUF86 domain-containing protein [Armatimonadota bacterium]